MLDKELRNVQLESLRGDNRFRDELIDKVRSMPTSRVSAIIGEELSEETVREVKADLDRIFSPDAPLPKPGSFAEAIVKLVGRPAYFVKNGSVELIGDDLEKWRTSITDAQNALADCIVSIGRVEVEGHIDFSWIGTGWFVEGDLLVTNRHVGEEIAQKNGNGFVFRSPHNHDVRPRLDYLAEHENLGSEEYIIVDTLYVAGKSEADIAVFRIDPSHRANGRKPLKLNTGPIREKQEVAVIGYPAYDSRASRVHDMWRIYRGIFDVKRFAPGEIIAISSDSLGFAHDATTLGGNSGSAVIDLQSCTVIGLHYSGREAYANYAVSSTVVLKVLDSIPSRFTSGWTSPAPSSSAPPVATPMSTPVPEANRRCRLQAYEGKEYKLGTYKIGGRMIAYASPDSTYAVTRKLFSEAEDSILIGIYDFTAPYMVEELAKAMERGVRVSLMLDLDGQEEQEVFEELGRLGCETVPAPACSSKRAKVFRSSHEKVIVIDDRWTLVQSGNYSVNSIPNNDGDGERSRTFRTGNRDTGIAIESRELARLFTKVLRDDMKMELEGEGLEQIAFARANMDMLIERPSRVPDRIFPSQMFDFGHAINVQPVLTPDNYVETVSQWLSQAKDSIRIEQQYIRMQSEAIQKLLSSIDKGVNVEIILGKVFDQKDWDDIKKLRKRFGADNVRIISLKHFVHCHNKMIIVDGESVLISSQNWSQPAVTENREAGVIVHNEEIAEYFGRIFEADWSMSSAEIDEKPFTAVVGQPEALARGNLMRASLGDYIEV